MFVYTCVLRLANTLKPEYSEALRAIAIEGTPVKSFAQEKDLSASNAWCSCVPSPRSAP